MDFTNHKALGLAPAADRYNTNPATDIVNGGMAQATLFTLIEGAGGTGTAVLTIESCTDAVGNGNTAIPFLVKVRQTTDVPAAWTAVAAGGYTTIAGANKIVEILVPSQSLLAAKPYVRMQITESVDNPCAACVLIEQIGSRQVQDVMDTILT